MNQLRHASRLSNSYSGMLTETAICLALALALAGCCFRRLRRLS
jgi:hypothetical protein